MLQTVDTSAQVQKYVSLFILNKQTKKYLYSGVVIHANNSAKKNTIESGFQVASNNREVRLS